MLLVSFIYFFLLIDDSSFIRGYTNPPVLKFKNLWFLPYVDMTSQARVNQIRPAKSCSCLIFFVKVASGRSLVIRLYYMKWQHTKKGKILSSLLPIGDRKRLSFVRFLF